MAVNTGQGAAANKAGSATKGPIPPAPKPTPKPTAKPKSKTAAEIAAAEVTSNAPVGNASTEKKTVSGIPLGTKVVTSKIANQYGGGASGFSTGLNIGAPVFGTVIYTVDSPFTVPATLSNAEKANLLYQLGLIPGLYSKGDAPTAGFIQGQGLSVTFRPQDTVALGKIMAIADQQGFTYNDTLLRFIENPTLSQQYFKKVSPSAKVVPTTNPDALIAEMNSKYMDLFNAPEDKKTAMAYATEINKAEKEAGLKGYQFTAQEKENIFAKYVQRAAEARYSKVKLTPDTADDIILEEGVLGNVIRQLRDAHADNGLPVSERSIYTSALKGIRSEQALRSMLDSISIQASTQFPAFKEEILKGTSVKTLLSPYVSSYEKLYGTTPKITDFYSVAAGKTAIPVSEWEKSQWLNPKLKETKFYRDTVNNDLRAMADAFGVNV